MEATVEISMYPLDKNYEGPILEFIAFLKGREGYEVRVNETSTHLFGNYDAIFEALKAGISRAFESEGKAVFVLKVLGANLQGPASAL